MSYDYGTTTVYELANEVFDEEVFGDDSDLKAYNGEPSPYLLRDELYEIIGRMCHEAVSAMREQVKGERDAFLTKVREVRDEG